MTSVHVLRGPAPDVDTRTWKDLARSSAAAMGIDVRCVDVGNTAAFVAAIIEMHDRGDAAVLVPGRHLDVASAQVAGAIMADDGVWLDVNASPAPGRTEQGQLRIQGRGLAGLTWALRRLASQRHWPVRTIELTEAKAEGWAELRLPLTGDAVPAVVLVHGGFWRSNWQLDLMDDMAIDLARRGIAAWNLEFRRPDRHGWAATVRDVTEGVRALAGADPRIDLSRIALVGHSAGAQLVLQTAADGVTRGRVNVVLVVSLAGLVDLEATYTRDLGDGAVSRALGGTPQDDEALYHASSPIARLPIGVPQLVVQGTDDDVNLLEMNRRYVSAARAAGDTVDVIEDSVNHFAVIDPRTDTWEKVAEHIGQRLTLSPQS